MKLTAVIQGTSFTFRSLKDALNKASEQKSGDHAAGLAAHSLRERIAAKRIVAEMPLWAFYENPSVPYEDDEITRLIIDDLNEAAYKKVYGWTVAPLVKRSYRSLLGSPLR
jgi:ethanolamine ammonia-lyase large subunit